MSSNPSFSRTCGRFRNPFYWPKSRPKYIRQLFAPLRIRIFRPWLSSFGLLWGHAVTCCIRFFAICSRQITKEIDCFGRISLKKVKIWVFRNNMRGLLKLRRQRRQKVRRRHSPYCKGAQIYSGSVRNRMQYPCNPPHLPEAKPLCPWWIIDFGVLSGPWII